jgi:putative membrane protein (TIGR04086 family)
MAREGGALAAGQGGSGLQARAVLVGVVCTFLISLVLSGALAIAVYVGGLGEGQAGSLLFYAGLLSLAAGAAYGARQAGSLGWAHGMLVGVAYVLVASAFGTLLLPGGMTGAFIPRLLLGIGVGAAGGILGLAF